MKSTSQTLPESLFLALFVAGCLILAGVVIGLRLPGVIVLVGLVGVTYPAYSYTSRLYLVTLGLYGILVFGAAQAISRLTPELGVQIGCLLAAILVLNEMLHRLKVEAVQRELLLIESRKRLEEAQTIAHVGHFIRDLATGEGEWSQEAYAIYGLDPAAGLPSIADLDAMQHPDDRERVLAARRRADALGEPIDVVHRIVRPDGRVRYVRSTGYGKPGKPGEPPLLMGTVTDVTETTLAQQALRAGEERIRSLIESAPVSILIVDEAGVIIQANPQVGVAFGYQPEEVVGRPLDILLPPDTRSAHQDLVKAYFDKPAVRLMGPQRELSAVRKDGSRFPVEIGLSAMEVKKQTFAIAWIVDITERREAEDALRQSEQYFKLLHETGRELSTTLDLDAIHESSFRAIVQVMDCNGLIISSYTPGDDVLRGVYGRLEGRTIDAGELPPIPIGSEGPGAQGAVVRSGESQIIPNYEPQVSEPAPAARSAVLVPLKLDGRVVGLMQVMSSRPDAYNEHHARFLESLAAHIVLARKNALLFNQVQQELAERKQAEEALQISEARYRAISNLMSDYTYSFRVGPKMARTLEWVAGAFVQITGYTPEELFEAGGWARIVLRRDIPTARRHTRDLLANHESVGEFRIATRDKRVRWLRDYARPVWDEAEGRVVRIIGAVEDITERRHAEDALIESEKLYRAIFENTPIGLAIVDPDGNILAFNEAVGRPGGYTREDVIALGNARLLYYQPEDRARVYEKLQLTGTANREPIVLKRKDGSPYDALLSLIPISLEGKPAFHAIIEDLTEQKRSESEIRRLFTAQERHLAELEALRRVTLDITSQLDLKPLLEKLVSDALGLLNVESGAIYMYEPGRDVLKLQYEFGTEVMMVGSEVRRGEGIAGRVLVSGQPMMVDNYSTWEGRARIYDDRDLRAVLGVPIIWGSQMLGVIDATSTSDRIFTREDARLLARFADQAAIAIQNARLYETEQKARTVAEIMYATSVALTQSLDLDERLNVFLKNLQTLVPFDSANVMLIEPDGRLKVHAALGYDRYKNVQRGVGTAFDLGDLAGVQEVINQLRTVHIPDVSQYERWVTFPDSPGIRCWIGVPLIADGEVIGLYCMDKLEARFFSEEHRYAAETLAAPAAIAIQNARLFESETRQLKLAQTLQKMGSLLTTQMQLDEVFEHIFDLLAEVVDFDEVSVFLIDEGGRVTLGAQRGNADVNKLVHGMQMLTNQKPRSTWWDMADARLVNDTESDPDWVWLEGMEHVRAWIGAPLFVRGRRIGVLNVDSARVNAFEPGMEKTVLAFANQAAVAIENVRLYAQSANRSQRLQLLNEITRIGTETPGLTPLLEGIVKIAAQLIGGDSASIMLWDEKQRLTTVAAVSGGPSRPFGSARLTPGLDALTATALRDGHPLAIEDYYLHAAAEGVSREDVAASSLLLPLQVGQLNLGALFIDFMSSHHFTDDEISWSRQAAELVALAVARAEMVEDLERRVEQRTAELQAANDRLIALTRLKDEFVSNVSHELRTPIASIKLYHSLVSLRPDKQEAYLDHLHRETKRLENIVEGLLHLSRLDQGRIELNLEPVDLNEMAEQFVADRTLLAEERGLTLALITTVRPGPVTGDQALLGQAISVLFTNALNYTPRGGRITIETAPAEHDGKAGATLTIQDTGPGISPAELPRLFERFFRGTAARSANVPGTGLGLAIAQEIVERHGGRLEVESSGVPGEGARFTIWLPDEAQEPEPGPGSKKPRRKAPGLDEIKPRL